VIDGLVADGTTLLLTTQYLDEAERLADDIVVIDRGSVIARGTASELKSQSGGDRVEVTVGDAAALDRVPALLAPFAQAGVAETVDVEARTVTVPVSSTEHIVPAVVRCLDDAGVEVLDVVVRRPTLDDVFLQLTGHRAEQDDDQADPSDPLSSGAPR
jgi:ABC-2 type transport system ATP-binding protein